MFISNKDLLENRWDIIGRVLQTLESNYGKQIPDLALQINKAMQKYITTNLQFKSAEYGDGLEFSIEDGIFTITDSPRSV